MERLAIVDDGTMCRRRAPQPRVANDELTTQAAARQHAPQARTDPTRRWHLGAQLIALSGSVAPRRPHGPHMIPTIPEHRGAAAILGVERRHQ